MCPTVFRIVTNSFCSSDEVHTYCHQQEKALHQPFSNRESPTHLRFTYIRTWKTHVRVFLLILFRYGNVDGQQRTYCSFPIHWSQWTKSSRNIEESRCHSLTWGNHQWSTSLFRLLHCFDCSGLGEHDLSQGKFHFQASGKSSLCALDQK